MANGKLKGLLKKTATLIGRTAGGKNAAGETLHGILDLLPIPNQPIGKLVEAILSGNWQEAKVHVGNILTIRNGVAFLLTILVLFGVVSYEDIVGFFNILTEILELFNSVGVEA